MNNYTAIDELDPIKYYSWPVFGKYYWQRVGIALAECKGGKRILEIGFGSGITFSSLLEKYEVVYGVEQQNGKSISNIKKTAVNKEDNIYLISGDAFFLPFPSTFFDTILLISVIEHFHPTALDQFFKEIHRVLSKQGELVYGVPVDNLITRFGFRFLDKDIKHHHLSNEKQIEDSAKNFLSQAEKKRVNFLIPTHFRSNFFSIYEVIRWKKTN